MSIKRLGGRTGDAGMFPPPPLKFRTAGFPQYGFKLDISQGDLRQSIARPLAQDTHLHRTTADLYAITRPPQAPLWSFRTRLRGPLPGRSSPAALGSPAGCVVPLGRRLLWPHPSLSGTSADLLVFIQRIFPFQSYPGLSLRGSPIYSACLSLRAAFNTPWTRKVHLTISSPPASPSPVSHWLGIQIFHAIRYNVVG